jgi:hypothetical protein
MDLKDNDLVLPTASVGSWNGVVYTGITGLVASGRNGGNWNGPGLLSSTAAANITSLAVATGADIGITNGTWSGQNVSASSVLVMYTYGGDANLDGKINILDYTRIDQGLGAGLKNYTNGDFNYDGTINILDYTIIDQSLASQGPPLGSAGGLGDGGPSGVSSVPEPASVGVLMLSAAAMGMRRRRRNR